MRSRRLGAAGPELSVIGLGVFAMIFRFIMSLAGLTE